jgi:hypothetical protein
MFDRIVKVNDSEQIARLAFRADNSQMLVEYTNMDRWLYEGVDVSVFGILVGSESIGKAWNTIKSRYIGRKLPA